MGITQGGSGTQNLCLMPCLMMCSGFLFQADGASAAGRKSTVSRERLKRSQKSTKVEGPEPVPAESSLSAEQGTMTEVKVKTELPDDYIQEVIWQGEAKEEKKEVGKDGTGDVPAEICVVIGGVRNQQTLGECLSEDWDLSKGRNG